MRCLSGVRSRPVFSSSCVLDGLVDRRRCNVPDVRLRKASRRLWLAKNVGSDCRCHCLRTSHYADMLCHTETSTSDLETRK